MQPRETKEMVELLGEYVTDFNTANAKGQTVLMLAIQNNTPKVVDYLLTKGADALLTDNAGNTLAYYWADSFKERETEAFDQKSTAEEKELSSIPHRPKAIHFIIWRQKTIMYHSPNAWTCLEST